MDQLEESSHAQVSPVPIDAGKNTLGLEIFKDFEAYKEYDSDKYSLGGYDTEGFYAFQDQVRTLDIDPSISSGILSLTEANYGEALISKKALALLERGLGYRLDVDVIPGKEGGLYFAPKIWDFFFKLFKVEGREFKLREDHDFTEFSIFGGYGSSKTFIKLLSCYLICNSYPGCLGCAIRDSYRELDDSIIGDFNKMFGNKGYKYESGLNHMRFDNGSILRFRSFDQPEKILGGNYDFFYVSQAENVARELYNEIFGRMRGAATQIWAKEGEARDLKLPRRIVLTEGNPSAGWAYSTYKKPQKQNNVHKSVYFIECTTYDNEEYLNYKREGYIEQLEAKYPVGSPEHRRNVLGEWGTHEESVFHNFDKEVHVIPPIDYDVMLGANYTRAAGLDYGYRNPTAIVWAYIDYDDNIVVYSEFYLAQQGIPEIRDALMEGGNVPCPADPSMKSPDRDGKDLFHELLDEGCNILTASKKKDRNITRVNQYLQEKRLFICSNCVNLLEEISEYKYKPHKMGAKEDAKEEVIKKNDHAVDAMMYMIAYIDSEYSMRAPEYDVTKTIKYKMEHAEMEGEDRKMML